ncbi:FecR family protein [uncultured Bacteroides sp.]|uniref:FecR family protein n=1 Tax=uncultured Bacteroides sp. TaxID=162156 RepID=UPI00261A58C5|nr:FecR domain-containing protein [uncultured Bacteroides sp.]
MEQEFEKILDKLVASTRSPRGRFSKESSWNILERRLPNPRRRILSLQFFMKGAAAVAVLCVLGWWTYYMFAPIPMQTVSTLAETRSVTLPDQTTIVLNRYSSLSYPKRFRGKERKVQLEGEAYFEVSKDTAHPFKVETGKIEVQVLGTHFNVDAYPEDTEIKATLLEGSVAVSLIGRTETKLVLSPNESAIYNKEQESLTLHTEKDAAEEVSWQEGILLFKNVPLQEIARKLSNTFRTDIRIEGTELQNYRMTATFADSEPLEEILSLLCRNQKFEYTKTNDHITITQKLN